jgi:hypothetical protein
MKYRVWDKRSKKYFKQGEWETYVWIDHDGKPFEINITVHGQWVNPKDVSDLYEIEYSIDKEDESFKTIYQGDIINVKGFGGDYQYRVSRPMYIYYPKSACKILGNKNENPELWENL